MSATLCLSFDNLGEAAEIEMGAIDPGSDLGGHATATRVVPAILEALGSRDLRATFFVEGLNAELYPELLREIDAAGHEVAYHAWRHEQWSELAVGAQGENLARGVAAFAELELEISGLRPPGGGLGEGGVELLHKAGLSYCSPAGEGAGVNGELALLPFQWRHVDAAALLPPLAAVREQIAGSPEALDPDLFLAHLESEVSRLGSDGGFATFVLHPVMVDAWFGEERLAALLDRIARAAAAAELLVTPCREAAARVLADPCAFAGVRLDSTTWS